MILTKKELYKICKSYNFVITTELQTYILSIYGYNPDEEHEWSEQDIYEQVRKIILKVDKL
ncbi:hypothetical protein [Clostridium estertheticum]|uniref:hypothetical protein n=1 Tax=Clostridium estertheticum TaxID=238834 RepID=UPI001CF35236|nr:hypothetical protein [Clostridium estertheticum]MCB2362396.1 hypothetical protein [Clostridium estertheticum]